MLYSPFFVEGASYEEVGRRSRVGPFRVQPDTSPKPTCKLSMMH